jgi:hypothetical protein
MSRKLLPLLALLAIFLLPSSCAQKGDTGMTTENAAELLPAETIAFWTTTDAKMIWNTFEASNFMKELKASTLYQIVVEKIGGEIDIEALEQFEMMMGYEPSMDNFLEMFGEHMTFAFISREQSKDFLLMSKVNPTSTVVDNTMRTLRMALGAEQGEMVEYEGISILTIPIPIEGCPVKNLAPPGQTMKKFSVCLAGDMLLACTDLEEAKRAIGILNGSGSTLAGSDLYKKTMKTMTGGFHSLTYVEMEPIRELVMNLIDTSLPLEAKKQMQQVSLGPEGMVGFGAAVRFGDMMRMRLATVLDESKMTESEKKLFMSKRSVRASNSFVPMDAIAFESTVIPDPVAMIEYISKQMTSQASEEDLAEMRSGIAEFETMLGMSLKEDVLPAIGNEGSFSIIDVDLAGPFPIPSAVLALEIKDKATWDAFILKLLELVGQESEMPLTLAEETYGSADISYLPLPMGENVRPAFAYSGDYWVFASNVKKLKMALDTKAGKNPNISTHPDFKTLGLEGNYSAVMFFDVPQFMGILKTLAMNYRMLYDSENKMYEPMIAPAFELMEVFGPMGGYSVTTSDGSVGEMIWIIEDLPADQQ